MEGCLHPHNFNVHHPNKTKTEAAFVKNIFAVVLFKTQETLTQITVLLVGFATVLTVITDEQTKFFCLLKTINLVFCVRTSKSIIIHYQLLVIQRNRSHNLY